MFTERNKNVENMKLENFKLGSTGKGNILNCLAFADDLTLLANSLCFFVLLILPIHVFINIWALS